jgi:hypothetical protein
VTKDEEKSDNSVKWTREGALVKDVQERPSTPPPGTAEAAGAGSGAAPVGEKANANPGVTLSDGRVANVRDARGRDLEKGAAVASSATNPMSLMMGVAAQVTTIDGRAVVYEDILDLPMTDVLKLIGALMGNEKELSLLSGISS